MTDPLKPLASAGSPLDWAANAVRFFALIPCAGKGGRALLADHALQSPDQPAAKQYREIAGQSVVAHTLQAFAGVQRLASIWVVLAPDDTAFEGAAPAGLAGFDAVRCGGASRAESVLNGLAALQTAGASDSDWVLVHDAARCLVTSAQIDRLIDACQHDAVGGLLAHKVADTLKSASGDRVAGTVDRTDKWLAQTPQMFRIAALAEALQRAGDAATDESSAMEAMGLQPRLVANSAENFKVTYPEDFQLAEAVLRNRQLDLQRNLQLDRENVGASPENVS